MIESTYELFMIFLNDLPALFFCVVVKYQLLLLCRLHWQLFYDLKCLKMMDL